VSADYGWHYRSGEFVIAHGVPHHDVFSYTAQDFAWVNHEWLSDVVTYGLVHWWGYAAAGLVFAGVWAAAVLVVSRWRPELVTVGLVLGALWEYAGVRPEAWTALGLAFTLRILEWDGKRLWWLLPLYAVWANLHAGFAVGLVMVGLKAVLDRSWRLALWLAAAGTAVLINPFGAGIYVELWRTLTDGHLGGLVAEWAPLSVDPSVMPYLLMAIVVLVSVRKRDFGWWGSLGLTLAAIVSNRQVPLLVVGSMGFVEPELKRVWRLVTARLRRPVVVRWAGSLLVGIAFPLSLWFWPQTAVGAAVRQPARELLALRNQVCQGRVFNDYNYGGLMILWLGVPDYIDGRMPSWQGPRGRYLDLYARVLQGGTFADQEFTRYGVKCALLSDDDKKLSARLASKPGWRLAVRADGAELWRSE
jgi:hypothetical protein